ncbi:pectinesterase inhibitor isoform X2 [Prunus persica]|uniref:pectinesterase inhibitor isoform X2 n=2 Tax=Prunus persica TaxID=3760 RepID=UPI0002C1E9D4|nr:pectinesterase inhibitor isoform X2 [Prunus persica]
MNPIAAAPFVFLSTLSVLQFVLVAGHESQGTNGGSKAGVVNMNLIQQACQHAPHKDLCIDILKNDPNSKGADLTGLAYIAIRLAGAYASEVDAHLRSLLINNATTLSPVVQQGVADCIEHYSDANEQLDDCIAAMSTKNFKDVEVWVNVAISDADYCDDSFSGEKSVVLQKNEAFRQLCNNVLAVVKALPPHGKE